VDITFGDNAFSLHDNPVTFDPRLCGEYDAYRPDVMLEPALPEFTSSMRAR